MLALLDLRLPGLGGLDVLRWIRSQPGLTTLRVAMLTSSDLGPEIDLYYETGANASFTSKPVNLDSLVDMMRVLREHWLQFAKAPQISRR